MKKLVYSIVSLAMAFFCASCQNDKMEPVSGDGNVTFELIAPGSVATKAVSDGMKVNEVWYAVYKGETGHDNSFVGGSAPMIFDKVNMSGKHASLSLNLLQDQNYVMVFWAQVSGAGHYNLGDLRQISLADAYAAATDANDETRDAFYAVYKFSTPVKEVQRVNLYRPFAQLNLATTVESLTPAGYLLDPLKSSVKVTGLSTVFNVLDGTEQVEDAGDPLDVVYTFKTAGIPAESLNPQTVTVNNKVYEKINVKGTDYVYIGMNYLFAPVAGTNVTVEYDIYTDKGGEHPVNNTIDNVTVKKNFRTNIIGNLLTSTTDFEIVVVEGFVDSETGAPNEDIIVDYWDGTSEKVVADPVTGNYVISSAEQLAWLSEEAAKQPYDFTNVFSYKTIEITKDINLNGKEFTPINMQVREDAVVTIKGNGHTISNFKVSGTEKVGLFSHLTGSVYDLHVSEVQASGTSYVGALAGYVSGLVEGCSADNVEIALYSEVNSEGKYADGDKGGALVGYFYNTESSAGLRNCAVTNTTVTGCRQLGAIVGYAYAGNVFEGNTAENVLITIDKLTYGSSYVKSQTAGLMNGNLPDVTAGATNVRIVESVGEGVVKETVNDEPLYTVSSEEGLETALKNAGAAGAGNSTISLDADMDMTNVAWTPIDVDGYHGADIVTVEGNGKVITGLTAPLFKGGFAGGSGIIIRNLTIADSDIVSTNSNGSGAFIESSDSQNVITLENCHLLNSSVTGSRTGGLIGWTSGYSNTSDGPVKTYVTVKDCSVIGCTITGTSVGGINGHAGASDWTYTTIENCEVRDCNLISTDTGAWRVGVVVGTANSGEVTINNITESGNTLEQVGKTAPSHSNLYGRFVPNSTGKLTIDGVSIQN